MKKLLKVLSLALILLSFTTLAFAQQEIKIGVIYPLTGPAASTGQVLLEGAKLAADIVNGKYNLNMPLAKTEGLPNLKGAKIKIIFADHQGNPQVGASEAERRSPRKRWWPSSAPTSAASPPLPARWPSGRRSHT